MKIELHPKGKKSRDIAIDLLSSFGNNPKTEVELLDYKSIGIAETLLITIIGTTVGNLLSHFFSELIRKSKEKNVTTIIRITDVKLIFKIPGDEDSLRGYIENNTDDN
ncbi:MAG: hypothetical protein LWX52_08825 [Deltaproteobacteria bacterium]|nr:hypothetical protein [Deltaproteobacteria bacterium]